MNKTNPSETGQKNFPRMILRGLSVEAKTKETLSTMTLAFVITEFIISRVL